MYNWNKSIIDEQIKYLERIESKTELIIEDIETLKETRKNIVNNYSYKYELSQENYDYNFLKKYNVILNPIIKKHINKVVLYRNLKLNKINISKKDILIFTQDMIRDINKDWFNTLLPFFYDKNILKYKSNISNYVVPIKSINKYYISLSKHNNVKDFIIPIHEYLHIYNHIKNDSNSFFMENEFLSILGELIVSYEMKEQNLFKEDVLKLSLINYRDMLYFIKDTNLRKELIRNKLSNKEKIYYVKHKYNEYINDVYSASLFYHYDTIISYFIAIELFNIYLRDKEKCMYLCDQLIKDNSFLNTKLRKYNINLLDHDEEYFKTLKKEYDEFK